MRMSDWGSDGCSSDLAAVGDVSQAIDLAARPYRAPLAERLAIRWNRLRRWEFWPAWLFYVPIVGYILWLGLRFRQPTAFTASNPASESGGVVGESKAVALGALMERATDQIGRAECGGRGGRQV